MRPVWCLCCGADVEPGGDRDVCIDCVDRAAGRNAEPCTQCGADSERGLCGGAVCAREPAAVIALVVGA